MKTILLQPAYILHRRSYRETSFLLDVFTVDHGRISLLSRGARKTKGGMQGLLQPFIPLLISWTGQGELPLVTDIEIKGALWQLQGESLFAGFYLNELVMRLLQKWDAHPALYALYEETIASLQRGLQEENLRLFEKRLLAELGYGVMPTEASRLFAADQYYRYVAEHGFVACDPHAVDTRQAAVFSGQSLLAFAREEWPDKTSLQDAKRLIRLVLTPLLGERPLYSRQLFKQPEEEA